ncbi:MAG: protoheme IX farnesyltransferase [Bacteroidia bacterium]|nr:protoheme IX farnesyltransferase [Bacteroidia bacterium]
MAVLISLSLGFLHKLSLYFQLTKPRLSIVVVFSAVMGALIGGLSDWTTFLWLVVGGYAITGSANAANQVWEKDTDALMERTRTRPLPAGLLSSVEGGLFSLVLLVLGLWVLGTLHWQVALLGGGAWALYVLGYTPLKRKGAWAVAMGAIPGALPPVIGYWAVHPELTALLICLFSIQFIWQFPHFWVIAWIAQQDYARAGFQLLPFPLTMPLANKFVLILSLFFLPIAAIFFWPWLPWETGLWVFVVSMGVATFGFLGAQKGDRFNMRLLLLGLTSYLTLLYLGIWLL